MQYKKGFIEELNIETVSASKQRVEMVMPIGEKVQQPFGFLHGGATIALLETAASLGAELNANLEVELPFGIDVHVRHRKSGKEGLARGIAVLDKVENSKQYWQVTAYDDAGDVLSDGTIITKIVSFERLAQKSK